MPVSLLTLFLVVGVRLVTPLFVEEAHQYLSAGFKEYHRMGRLQEDITVIEVSAKLMFMVEDIGLIDKKRVTLELAGGDGEWVVAGGGPVVRGGVYTWTESNIAPCLSHRVRLWVYTKDGSQQSFTSPTVVPAVNISSLIRHNYRPGPPLQLETVETLYALVVSWKPSACSESYLVSYTRVAAGDTVTREVAASPKPSLLLTTNIQPCAEYEVKVVAALAQTYSQETVRLITTAPLETAAEQLEISVEPGRDHATVRWNPVRDLPCVRKYNVSLCQESGDCLDSKEVDTQRDINTEVLYSANNSLSECSNYFLKVFPIYSAKKMREKVVHFHTSYPPLTNFAEQLGEVDVRLVAGPALRLTWTEVRCATQYQVLHGDTYNVTDTNHFTLPTEHCQEYSLAIRTILGSHRESEVVPVRRIVTEIENPEYYILPNLEVETELEAALLSWEHRPCIQSYRIKLCQENYSDKICFEKQIIPSAKVKILNKMSNLKMCSIYSLDIFPLYNGSEIKTKTTKFRTKSQVQNPKNVKLTLDRVKDKVNIQWDPVSCAKTYKIFQKFSVSRPSQGSEWTYLTNKLKVRLNSPEPCSSVSFGISTVFNDQESLPPEWFQLSIPPKFTSAFFPVLTIRNHLNSSSSTFIIEGSSRFSNCKVEMYQIKQEGSKKVSTFKTSAKGKINVEMMDRNTNLEMRVKYHGFQGWSQWQWVASEALRSEYQTDEQLHRTLVILLGCFLLLVIWLLIITLAVLCRRQRNRKETECETKETIEVEHFIKKEEKEGREEKEEKEEVGYISEPPDVIQPVKLWYV